MTPKDDLFDLIKSLSPNEKRYFKIRHSSDGTNHMKLFDEIDSQLFYDEASIKEKYRNEKFTKQLTYTKNYLYNEIIESLIAYHRSSSSETELVNLVLKLRVLFKKGLFKQYFKQLESAKKKAWQYEKFYILLEILRMSRLILDTKKYRVYSPEEIYAEEALVLSKIENLSHYSQLFNKTVRLKRKIGLSISEINIQKADEILKDPLISRPENALSTQALEYFYNIKQLLYFIKGDLKNQQKYCVARLGIIENSPKPFMDDIINVRKEALYSLIEISVILKDRTSFSKYMSKYHILSGRTELSKIDYSILSNFMNLMFMVSTGDFTNEQNIIDNAKNDLVTYKNQLNRDTELESMFLLVKYYFLRKRFIDALNNINSLLEHPVIKYRRDIYAYSKIMNILIHYELGNFTLLEYLIDSLKKTLKNEKEIYRREIIAIDILNKSMDKVKADTRKYRDEADLVNAPLYYFDALEWVLNKFNSTQNPLNKAI